MTTTSEPSAAPPAPAATGARPARDVARHVGDAVALLLLATVLWWLASYDGGRDLAPLRWAAVLTLVTLPVLAGELRRLPRPVVWLLALWVIGTILSVALGQIRAYVLRPALVHAIVPVVFLAAHRIRRRPWWPLAVAGLLAVTLGLYWQRTFQVWWVKTLEEQQPVWLALSWRNQSGILLGALGLAMLGVAVTARRVWRAAAVVLASLALAGTWLSSSRGALLVTAVAGVLLLAGAARDARSDRRRITAVVATTAVTAALTFGVAQGLLAMDQRPDAASPLASRTQSVEHNSRARIHHAEAALGMFVDRPLVGQGLGSYQVTAVPFTSPDANLTSSAHNEYVENLGEGGLPLGLAFLALNGLAALAALRRLWRGGGAGDDLARGLSLGAAGVVLAIGAHSAMDFDWRYLVLPSLLALAAAVLVEPAAQRPAPSRPVVFGTAAGMVVLLAVPTLALSQQLDAPRVTGSDLSAAEFAAAPSSLDLDAFVTTGYRLLETGQRDLAGDVADRGLAWHPGSPRLQTLRAIVRYQAGELSPAELADGLQAPRNHFDEFRYVATVLLADGELEVAGDVLDRQRTALERHAGWGVTGSAQESWVVRVGLAEARGGCSAAVRVAEEAVVDPLADFPAGVDAAGLLSAAGLTCGDA